MCVCGGGGGDGGVWGGVGASVTEVSEVDHCGSKPVQNILHSYTTAGL